MDEPLKDHEWLKASLTCEAGQHQGRGARDAYIGHSLILAPIASSPYISDACQTTHIQPTQLALP
jgi:hypothetical protein